MKTFFVSIISFIAGAALLYGWTQYTALKLENERLHKQTAQATLSPTTMISTSPEPMITTRAMTATAPDTAGVGTIQGKIGYPSEGIPPLQIYAINVADSKKYQMVETEQNKASFTMEVPAGTYHVVAYAKGYSSAGGYTQAVPCGLSVSCTDHSLIDVSVAAGKTVSTVEVRDWYAPDGTFPAKPN